MTNGVQCKHPAGTFQPVIDRNRCEGKGPCVDVCPFNVFEVATLPQELRRDLSIIGHIKGFAHRWQQALVINPNACESCGLCVKACPEKAIKLARA